MIAKIKNVSTLKLLLCMLTQTNCQFLDFTFADPIEHATGEEKIMLILEERGITVSF